MIKKFIIFENYSIYYSATKELINQLDSSFVEEYYSKHLAYTDIDDILEKDPSIIWNHVNDKSAMEDVIDDECNFSDLEDFHIDDLKERIKDDNNLSDDDKNKIYQKYIDENFTDKIEDLKSDLELVDDEDDIEEIKNKIEEIKDVKERDIDDIVDELSEDNIHELIDDIYDRYEFIRDMLNDRYLNYTLQDYFEEVYGNISFGRKSGYDWILNYVDDSAVIEEYNNNEDYSYKEDRVQEDIGSSIDIQEELLRIDSKNSLLLFDVFTNNSYANADTIENDYEFQKAYINSYSENYADGLDDEYVGEGKAEALKKLNDNFNLDSYIEEEYSEFMYKVISNRFNL